MAAAVDYFTQVVFRDVQETYSSLTDLSCQFTVSAAVSRDAADSVAIFPVGWKSVKDHVCSVPVAVPDESNGDVTASVVFPAESLPHNDNEFYQLCFVSGADQRVRGASSPFQFTNDRTVEWELVDGKDPLFEMAEKGGETSVTETTGTVGAAISCEPELINVEEATPPETCCQHVEEVERLKKELQTVKQELTLKNEEVLKREAEFNCSLAALQVALDDDKQQNVEKTLKLEQVETEVNELTNKLAGMSSSSSNGGGGGGDGGGGGGGGGADAVPDTMQETINKLNEQMNAERNAKQQEIEEHKRQQDALRAEMEKQQLEFGGVIEGLKTELETTRDQLDNSTVEVEQLKVALNKYKQSEAEWKQRSQNRTSADVTAGSGSSQETVLTVDGGDEGQRSSADNIGVVVDVSGTAATRDSLTDLTATQQLQFERGKPLDKCPICAEDFGPNPCEEYIAGHIEDHVVKICPYCTLEFEPEKEQEYCQHISDCQRMYDRNMELDNRQP